MSKKQMVTGAKKVARFLGEAGVWILLGIVFLLWLGYSILFGDDEPPEYWMGGQ